MSFVRVDSLLTVEGLALEVVAGSPGLGRRITGPRIQKPGLALTGYTAYVHSERAQVLGLTEVSYLESCDEERRRKGLRALMALNPCVLIVTRGLETPKEAVELANEYQVP